MRAEGSAWDPIAIAGGSIDPLQRMALTFEQLLYYDKETFSLPRPGLAESWSLGADGVTWTFKLYPGIKASDGVPFTSADVANYFNRMMKPPEGATRSTGAVLIANKIKEVTTPDDLTVVIVTHSPDAEFITNISGAEITIPPKRIYDAGGPLPEPSKWIGTGPYIFKVYERNIRWEVERNPNYRLPGLPYLDGVRYAVGSDQAAMFAAFRTGRIHYTARGTGMQMTEEQVGIVKGMRNVKFSNDMVAFNRPLVGNTQRPPFNDIRVRKAVDLALDRKFVCDVAFGGLCRYGYYMLTDHPYGYTEQEVLGALPGYRQPKPQADLDEAKRLLAAAGYPQGFPIKMHVSAGFEKTAEAMQFDLEQKLGIKAELIILDRLAETAALDAGEWTFRLTAQSGLTAAAGPNFTAVFCDGGKRVSVPRVCDPKVDEMITNIPRISNDQERKRYVRELLGYLYDQSYLMFGVFPSFPGAWYDSMKNWRFPAGRQHDMVRMEDVWLDS
ncbi:MAG: ABC transporter substrate-binding protein [Chloroflexi bacterium]|nr:ABC transporter substrate-binding protein [Chloroflexota bacterium]